MDTYSLIAIVLSIVVLIGYVNAKVLKLQTSIAMMLSAMVIALVILVLKHLNINVIPEASINLVSKIHFGDLLLKGFLSFLLFAGALTLDFGAMRQQRWMIGSLATLSTLASTALVAISSHYLLALAGIDLPWIYACLFGALISPTDPIAVLTTFKQLGAPKHIKASVAGESLFNDGVGIVIFTTLFQLLSSGAAPTTLGVTGLFLQQAVGGIVYGAIIGWIALWLCRHTNDNKLMLLTTLAVVTGAYNLSLTLDISGPLAMVIAGMWVGNGLRKNEHFHFLETFWETMDEVLNAVLFLLVGFELLDFSIPEHMAWLSLLAIPLLLIIRCITVSIPIKLAPKKKHQPGMVTLLTWGGLRGGLAIALALSIPEGQARNIILTMTYAIVSFSVIVQGLSIGGLVRRFYPLSNRSL